VSSLRKKCWSRPEEISAALEQLSVENCLVPAANGWLHREVVQKHAEHLLAVVHEFHADHPQHAGLSREDLQAALNLNPDLLDPVIESLLRSRQLERNGTLLARAGWQARLPDRDQKACAEIATKMQQAGWTPPGLEELAVALGETPKRVAALAELLAERGVVVRLDNEIWMHRDAVEAGKQTALRLFRRAPAFSTMEFRDALGVSRKFAVPLADYLDKIRFTARSGNHRTPGMEAKKLLNSVAADARRLWLPASNPNASPQVGTHGRNKLT
jgi:selenocysteine-specific elongation factor